MVHNFSVKNKKITSNASRFNSRIITKFFIKNNLLNHSIKGVRGRGVKSKVLFTKKYNKFSKRNSTINYVTSNNKLSMVSYATSSLNNSMLYYTIVDSLGTISNFRVSNLPSLLNLFFTNFTKNTINNDKFSIVSYVFSLIKANNKRKIILISGGKFNSVIYSRSLGSYSKIIKKDVFMNTSLVKLPSGVKKTFSLWSLCSIHVNTFLGKKLLNNKAGYHYNLGKKPSVRGVAKNPVDHPHGGRGSSISHQRTPWGKTTKIK